MKSGILILLAVFLLISSNMYAQDISIDGNGNLTTGSSNASGNLKVTGSSGEHGVVGEASGTGAAGIYGKNTDSNNYGLLGNDNYGVYGNSASGYAGYFEGNAKITGNLTVDGTITGETDPTVNANVKDGVDWTELTGIPAGFADDIDNTGGGGIWTQNGFDIYYTSGNVGIGTSVPSGKLDVNGDICLGSVCRTTWPAGSGTGAFTDTGTSAYYNGGNVGIGTNSPAPLGMTDTRVLHLLQPVALLDNAAAGIRLEVENIVNGGITSAYNTVSGDGGIFVGALSNHRLGFITNSMEQMSLAPNGNLGIGTTSPLQPLHVQGNAYIYQNLGIGIDSPTNDLEVSGSDALLSAGTGDFRLHISKNLAANQSSLIFEDNYIGYAELGLTGDDNFHLKVSADGFTFSDAMVIDHNNGNIGIGIAAPEAMLNVLSDGELPFLVEDTGNAMNSALVWKKGDGDAVYILKQLGTGSGLVIKQVSTGPAVVIKNSSSDIFVIESSGNVGIGTSTPAGTLDVNGAIYQRGGILHADYVFEPGYQLESIKEHADFMWQNRHLKAIPKAKVDNNGEEIVEVGSHRRGIVEEVEKAHIYIEQLHGQITEQNKMIQQLEQRLAKIEAED